jgi:hypothetical protein
MKAKLLVSMLLLLGLLSPQAFAADTVCSIVYGTGDENVSVINASNGPDIGDSIPVPDTTIAVASNFYAPAIELAGLFLESAANTEGYTSIGVCHNATGHLVNEITGNNPAVIDGEWLSAAISYKYSLFAAANAGAPENLATSYKAGPVRTYAKGIPAFLAGETFTGSEVAGLVTAGTGEKAVSGISFEGTTVDNIGPIVMNSTLAKIGIANPGNAPYGLAAKSIIMDMGQWDDDFIVSKTGNSPTPCDTIGSLSICQYDNIDITYAQTVLAASTLNAGWVSWAQILSAGNADPYIIFPDYDFPQKAVLLTSPNPFDAATVASAFWDFLDLEHPNDATNAFYLATGTFYTVDGYTWNGWLAKKGYGPILYPN